MTFQQALGYSNRTTHFSQPSEVYMKSWELGQMRLLTMMSFNFCPYGGSKDKTWTGGPCSVLTPGA